MRRWLPFLVLLLASTARAENPVVRFATPVGSWDAELCAEISTLCLRAAPLTVANFLNYVDDGDYGDSFVHRAPRDFVIQGGSFTADHVNFHTDPVPVDAPIASEFQEFSNVRGTISVPLPPDPPTSTNPCDTDEHGGTSGWFVNIGDNSGLDCGFFTVFGVVLGDGMQVVDAIDALFRLNFGLGPSPVTDDYECNPNAQQQCTTNPIPYLVYTGITRVPEPGPAASAAILALAALWRRRQVRPRSSS
jgi:cyclophilin family peptidyl-prolyl cis-trans isomerase